MLKLLNTSVAKLVGATSAVVFQHICYWMQTQSKETVYRTNKQLSEDLDGIYSPQQIQRAKKKLIDEGLIVVTADKRDAWNRTSHYSLTDKGRSLLLSVNNAKTPSKTLADASQNHSDSTKEAKTYTKQCEGKNAKYERSINAQTMSNNSSSNANNPMEHNKAMKESFKEGFSNANAVPMPENIKSLFKCKKKENNEDVLGDAESAAPKQSWDDVVKAEMEMLSDHTHITNEDCHVEDDVCYNNEHCYSDSDYNECEIAMLSSIEEMNKTENKHSNSPSITFAELMKTAYSKATTEAQEQIYRMKQESQYFVLTEEY